MENLLERRREEFEVASINVFSKEFAAKGSRDMGPVDRGSGEGLRW